MKAESLLFAVLFVLTGCSDSNAAPATPSTPDHVTFAGQCAARVTTQSSHFAIPNVGFSLSPLGRLTTVGNLPLGGAITPDGKQYWAVDSGYGLDDVQIVDLASGSVIQTLSLPGAYGAMVFSPDGLTAYVSGEPVGAKGAVPPDDLEGAEGDVIHVFKRVAATGLATEQTPIAVPATTGGSGRNNSLPPNPTGPAWPAGLAISPDGKTLVAALNMADHAAVVELPSGTGTAVMTGNYPYGAAIERNGRFAYVSNEFDGTLTKIDLTDNSTSVITGLGGKGGDYNAHPQNLLADPHADRLYAVVTNRDAIAVIDTGNDSIVKLISVARPEGPGASPVALALAPDGSTLYVANAGENAIVAIALSARSGNAEYSILGKVPTADYPHDVQLTPDGCTLVWSAARGIGTVANPDYQYWSFGPPSPYPSYVAQLLTGQVGVLPLPADAYFATAQTTVNSAVIPGDGSGKRPIAPADTPVVGPNGGPSEQIKYVFYVVRENRSYDQIFGSDPRGDGDPKLEMFDDNDAPAPVGGITPNAHALSRQFVLLDRFFSDSEVSLDGHVITSSAYAIDYVVKGIHGDYSQRGKPYDFGLFAVSYPPNAFLFDAAVRHSPPITFRNYGEYSGGIREGGDERKDSYAQVIANTDMNYPNDLQVGCSDPPTTPGTQPNTSDCFFDAGMGAAPPLARSRIDTFRQEFTAQLAADQVPHFNYLVLPSDHTTGVASTSRDPLAMVADNDLGLGQLVQLISNSAIWPQSAIFVVEDDSQDGADHVDAHRAPALVLGPWVKRGGKVIHTHYDQYSVIRTIELILGLDPLSIHDANAAPMFDVFATAPDNTPYSAIVPTQDIQAMCPCPNSTANVKMSAALPWHRLDAVPQELGDRLLWQRLFGEAAPAPAPGPNASRAEHQRAVQAMLIYKRHRSRPHAAHQELLAYLGRGERD